METLLQEFETLYNSAIPLITEDIRHKVCLQTANIDMQITANNVASAVFDNNISIIKNLMSMAYDGKYSEIPQKPLPYIQMLTAHGAGITAEGEIILSGSNLSEQLKKTPSAKRKEKAFELLKTIFIHYSDYTKDEFQADVNLPDDLTPAREHAMSAHIYSEIKKALCNDQNSEINSLTKTENAISELMKSVFTAYNQKFPVAFRQLYSPSLSYSEEKINSFLKFYAHHFRQLLEKLKATIQYIGRNIEKQKTGVIISGIEALTDEFIKSESRKKYIDSMIYPKASFRFCIIFAGYLLEIINDIEQEILHKQSNEGPGLISVPVIQKETLPFPQQSDAINSNTNNNAQIAAPTIEHSENSPTCRQVAMYLYYLIKGGHIEDFDTFKGEKGGGTKKGELTKYAKQFNLSSVDKLRQTYDKVASSLKMRIGEKKYHGRENAAKNLQVVCKMLETQYSQAFQIAYAEYEQAQKD